FLHSSKVVHPNTRKNQVGILDKFDGMWGMKAEVYASQVIFYITTNLESFLKVFFSLSYITGQASQLSHPLMKVCDDKAVDNHYFTQYFC
ncbi:uncharacterized protein VP01_3190g1, partial [Puccinia sorghi]